MCNEKARKNRAIFHMPTVFSGILCTKKSGTVFAAVNYGLFAAWD
jgi:hypothetical protein